MRVIGLDVGESRIGVALGDTESRIASPWAIVDAKDSVKAITDIRKIIDMERAERVVVGMPKRLHDAMEPTAQQQSIQTFIEALQVLGIPVEVEDETWTSKIASRQMMERGEKGKRDDLAAVAILETWLSRSR